MNTLARKTITEGYQSPRLIEVGTLHQLTLGCDKTLQGSDGFTFMGQPIHCRTSP